MTQQAFMKKKNTWLKMEEVIPDSSYALTINPMESYQYYDSNSIQRFHAFKRNMTVFLQDYVKPFSDMYIFNIELSTNGLLHLHGIINITHIVDFYLISIPRINRISSSYMCTIHEAQAKEDQPFSSWFDYCTKQSDIFSPLNPLIKHTDLATGIEDYIYDEYLDIIKPKPFPNTDKLKTQRPPGQIRNKHKKHMAKK